MVLRFHRMISGIKGHCSKGCFKKVGKFSFNTCPCGTNNECLSSTTILAFVFSLLLLLFKKRSEEMICYKTNTERVIVNSKGVVKY